MGTGRRSAPAAGRVCSVDPGMGCGAAGLRRAGGGIRRLRGRRPPDCRGGEVYLRVSVRVVLGRLHPCKPGLSGLQPGGGAPAGYYKLRPGAPGDLPVPGASACPAGERPGVPAQWRAAGQLVPRSGGPGAGSRHLQIPRLRRTAHPVLGLWGEVAVEAGHRQQSRPGRPSLGPLRAWTDHRPHLHPGRQSDPALPAVRGGERPHSRPGAQLGGPGLYRLRGL